jgi:hypothetical protein
VDAARQHAQAEATHMIMDAALFVAQAPPTPVESHAHVYEQHFDQTAYLAADAATFDPFATLEYEEAEGVEEMAVPAAYLDTPSSSDG